MPHHPRGSFALKGDILLMNKDYQKPEVEFVNLTAMENITTSEGLPGGDLGTSDNIFG